MRVWAITVLSVILAAFEAKADVSVDLSDNSRSMHAEPRLGNVRLFPAFEDYTFMLFDICYATEIKCVIFPMMGEVGTAYAYQQNADTMLLIYDRRLSPRIGYSGASSVIAHEVGHHYCGHLTFRKGISRYNAESEADRFAGFAASRLGIALSEIIGTYEKLGIDKGSRTHPPMSRRSLEVSKGYYATSLKEVCPGRDPV